MNITIMDRSRPVFALMKPHPRGTAPGRFVGVVLSGFLCLVLSQFLVGCRTHPPAACQAAGAGLARFHFKGAHMGTLFEITLYATNREWATTAAQAAFNRINSLEDILSDYQADSELSLLRSSPVGSPVPVGRDLLEVLRRSQQFSKLSGGAFDCTVGPYVRLWRFSRKRGTLPGAAELEEARGQVGYQYLLLDHRRRTVALLRAGMRLDAGGIAKGYAADEALKVLKSMGVDRALVAASGDIAIGNPPPGEAGWKVGVSGMDSRTNILSRNLVLSNAAVSTSGDTEQAIEIGGVRYSHIVDPRTGLGLTHRVQATVVGPDATTTDAAATAVCILGRKAGVAMVESLPGCGVLVITREQGHEEVHASPRLKHLQRQVSRLPAQLVSPSTKVD